jgi:hypothetical protein
MSNWVRIVLLTVALVIASCLALFGSGISRGLDPHEDHFHSLAFWFAIGGGLTFPLWLPALIPSKFLKEGFALRYLAALTILLPTSLFGSLISHNVSLMSTGSRPDLLSLGLGVLLTTLCLLGQALLLKPELSSILRRRTG